MHGKYKTLYEQLIRTIDRKNIFHDSLHTLAYGTDASFYRLIPKLVIRTKNEEEIAFIIEALLGSEYSCYFQGCRYKSVRTGHIRFSPGNSRRSMEKTQYQCRRKRNNSTARINRRTGKCPPFTLRKENRA